MCERATQLPEMTGAQPLQRARVQRMVVPNEEQEDALQHCVSRTPPLCGASSTVAWIGVVQSDPFEIAQSFIEQFERSVPLQDLKAAFDRATQELGFRYFACGSHVDPLHPPPGAVMYLTYPKEWVQHFSETRCHIA